MGQAVVVMGVSGSGKSTVGRALATHRHVEFLEADDLHPPANVARMAAGIPLDDEARGPWLDAVAAAIERQVEHGRDVVVACSALRRRYRDRLRAAGATLFVLLDVPEDLARDRVAGRSGHFMPASLLVDQFETLERPELDEPDVRVIDAGVDLEGLIARVVELIGRPPT